MLSPDLDISPRVRAEATTFIDILGRHDKKTADHCRRVARFCWELTKNNTSLPRELVVLGGLLHDIGKLPIASEVLWPEDHGRSFTEEHRQQLRYHPMNGHVILRTHHFRKLALIAGGHHYRGGAGYGIDPRSEPTVRQALKPIVMADTVDAIVSRNDSHHDFDRHDPELVTAEMLQRFPGEGNAIELLVDQALSAPAVAQ